MHLLIGIASTLEAIAKRHSNEYKEANQEIRELKECDCEVISQAFKNQGCKKTNYRRPQ